MRRATCRRSRSALRCGASTVGEVVASKADGFPVGQWVGGLNAIEEYSVSTAGGFMRLSILASCLRLPISFRCSARSG